MLSGCAAVSGVRRDRTNSKIVFDMKIDVNRWVNRPIDSVVATSELPFTVRDVCHGPPPAVPAEQLRYVVNARTVPLAVGRFDLDDYIDYLISMFRALGPDLHVMAVCQPSVPVIAAIAHMEAENDPFVPRSMTLMGGPIDTRRSPTAVSSPWGSA